MNVRVLPILLTFFVMGVADAMGPLADAVQRQFRVSAVMATLLTFFVFIAFAVFSVPGGLLATRIGKWRLLLLGLALNTLAVGVPAFSSPSFGLLLACIFALGVGTTFLQVAGNPVMRDVSAEGAYAMNLTFAQGIKGIGSFSSTWLVGGLAALFPFAATLGWRGAFPLFFALMVLAFFSVALVQVQETQADVPPGLGDSLALLKEPAFALAVMGIFLYVGAEVCMARFLAPQLAAVGFSGDRTALFGPAFFFGTITVGRLVGSAVLRVLSPRTFFRLSALLGAAGVGALLSGQAMLAVPGVLLAGLGFANIWPLLFSLTVEARPERGAELSGLMCMAISGGALVPLAMGRMMDRGLGALSFAVPLVCFAYLALLAFRKEA